MSRALLVAISLVITAACSASDTAPADGQQAADTGMIAATGFITENPVLPASLSVEDGDTIARDPDGRPYSYELLGKPLPGLSGQMADGTVFDPATLEGWMVIDVWGIWCGDCMADAPYVAALATAIDQDPDLGFLSIHTPANEHRTSDEDMFGKYGSVSAFFEAKGYSYPALIDEDASLRNALKISWTPSYLLVDPDGIIRGFRTDLSVAGGEPVKDFLKDVARARKSQGNAGLSDPFEQASIGLEGAMGLTGTIPFTTDSIRAAFPGHEIVPGQYMSREKTYPFFEVFKEEETEPLYRIEPDWTLGYVRRVSTTHPDVAGPSGEKIGVFPLNRLNKPDRSACAKTDKAGPPRLVCTKTGPSGQFHRIFDTAAGMDAAPLVEMAFLPVFAEDAD